MIKLSILLMLGVACVSGCTNQSTAPEPKSAPSDVDTESNREASADSVSSTSDADAEKSGADADEGKANTDQSEPTEESKPLGGVKTSPAKQACREHTKKSDCEVAMGCAWSTTKVCVDQ